MFAAYGIIAFRSSVTDSSRDRYVAICQGYMAVLPNSMEIAEKLQLPTDKQLATVWPLRTVELSRILNSTRGFDDNSCEDIVNDISIIMSNEALDNARKHTNEAFGRRGPYLLAWSPGVAYHENNALVLYLDLSDVQNDEQAVEMFNFWKDEIEKDPSVWYGGWNWERLRLKVKVFADRFGQNIFSFFRAVFN